MLMHHSVSQGVPTTELCVTRHHMYTGSGGIRRSMQPNIFSSNVQNTGLQEITIPTGPKHGVVCVSASYPGPMSCVHLAGLVGPVG